MYIIYVYYIPHNDKSSKIQKRTLKLPHVFPHKERDLYLWQICSFIDFLVLFNFCDNTDGSKSQIEGSLRNTFTLINLTKVI